MTDFFEQYKNLYENKYTIEAWIIWIALWAQYIGYYVCLYVGFLLILLLCILPIFSLLGLYRTIKIKIKTDKINKQKKKIKNAIEKNYISTLDGFTKKKKKKH